MSNVIQLFPHIEREDPLPQLIGLIIDWAQQNDVNTDSIFKHTVADFGNNMKEIVA